MIITLSMAYEACINTFKEQGIDEAEFKALCVVCEAAGIKNSEYKLNENKELDESVFSPFVKRVMDGEPLQYVLGKWDFYESEFYVGEGVLIPRPETEELVEIAINEAQKKDNPVIYDLCAGSGCIGISIAKKIPASTVYCVEKSGDAFKYLEKNAKGVNNVVSILADIKDDIELPTADIIVSNPPYIKSDDIKSLQSEVLFEPEMALDGGNEGLDFYRIIYDKYLSRLKKNGVLLLEIGNEQGSDIKSMFSDNKVEIINDMYGNPRIAIIVKE